MTTPFSDLSQTVFTDKRVLEEEYQPDTILEREAEIDAYRNALKDVLFGNNPNNVFIYGKTGVGKTAVTNYMVNALQTEAASRDEADELLIINHNCNGDGVYDAVRSLINSLRHRLADSHEFEHFPKKGLSTVYALETLFDELDQFGGTVLFVLDEIDHISDVDSLLYELPRARANGNLDQAKIGVIGISNNYSFRDSLSPKVKDTLMEKEISFSPYDAGELKTILFDRAERALKDGAYDEGAVDLCAAVAAKDTGSARQAIDLLREGGDAAEEQDDEMITIDHIELARDRVRRGRVKNKISDQTMHGQLVLEAVAHLEEQGKTPARSKTIQPAYEKIARSWDAEPLTTLKSIQSHLADLTMLGFLTRYNRNDGRAGGQYFEFELALEPDAVFEAREELESEQDSA